MSALHWLTLFAFCAISFVLFKNWDVLKPSQRRLLLLLCTTVTGLYFIPATYSINETTKTTNFCLRCHVMQQYGENLKTNDDEILSSVHFRNNYVPKTQACYQCHADYVMFQHIKLKLRGMKHIYVNTFGTIPKKLALYNPYPNANCLSCHQESEKYAHVSSHHLKRTPLEDINSGKVSCLVKGCHDVAHFYPEGMGK